MMVNLDMGGNGTSEISYRFHPSEVSLLRIDFAGGINNKGLSSSRCK